MLTALDFPRSLLYGQGAVWVRDDGGGSVRLGVSTYALAASAGWADGGAGMGAVIHVRIPRPKSRVVRGQVMGHIDLEGGTFDLVSPVTGEVLISNGSLRDDPDLLRRAPFGAGFLLDVEEVPKDERESLMDRDAAFVHYARVEPRGPLVAASQWDMRRPWPTALSASYGEDIQIAARLLPQRANDLFTPDWEPGDRWTVETLIDGVARRFGYRVEGEGRVAGAEVTRVRITQVPAADDPAPLAQRVLHFRKDDFTLAAWDEVPDGMPSLARRRFNPRPGESWLLCGREDGLILDQPRLPLGTEDANYDLGGAGADRFPSELRSPGTPPEAPRDAGSEDPLRDFVPRLNVYAKFRSGLTRCETEIRAELPRLQGGGSAKLYSMHVWQLGKPWWTEAYRVLDGKELAQAKLV